MIKDIVNPYNYLLKNANFLINQFLNNIIYHYVANFCFSVSFCNNSLLVSKMLGSKKVQGFSSNRKILMSLQSLLFHLQKRVSVFGNFNLEPRFLGKNTSCPWNQPHFLKKSDKTFYLPNETNKLKEIRDMVL